VSSFLYNVVIAFVWALLNGEVNNSNLFIGFIIGYVILGSTRKENAKTSYFMKVGQVIQFTLIFLKELLISSVRVAYDVVTPTDYAKPGIIAVPIDAQTDLEITSLANIISLTPGTLSLDVSKDRKYLYIHVMFIDNPDELRREIKEGLEKRLLEMMR